MLEKAREPFFTTKGVKGSGLGLSMIDGFARQSQGRMVIESSPHQGTRIALWLPTAEMPAAPDPTQAPLPPPRVAGRVLVTDDDLTIRTIIEAFLEQAGYDVTLRQAGRKSSRSCSPARGSMP